MSKRKTSLSEDREFMQEWDASLKVSSYADKILESMQTGQDIETGIVPDYSGGGAGVASDNESKSLFSMDYRKNDYMLQTAASALGVDGMTNVAAKLPQPMQKTASTQPHQTPQSPTPQRPQLKLSKNQLRALKRYPALIEFLGGGQGEEIAKNILAQVNKIVVKKVEANTKEVHKNVHACQATGQNIKTYFVGDDAEGQWVCCVIASGPFRGDEAVYYKAAEDKSYVIRKSNDDWSNVTREFNVVHEFARKGE